MPAIHPPLLPVQALRRVVRVARLDGMVVLTLSGLFALACAAGHDELGTIIGLLVAGAGAVELHGVALLRHGAERGMRWLVMSQLLLLVVILCYVGLLLTHIDTSTMKPLFTEAQRLQLAQAGMNFEHFLRMIYIAGCAIVGVGTLIYQGGLAIFYHRRRAVVAEALKGSGH